MNKLIFVGLLVGVTACGDDVKKRSDVVSSNNTVTNNTSNNVSTNNSPNNVSTNNSPNNVSTNNSPNNVSTNNSPNNVSTNNSPNNVSTNNSPNNSTNNATTNPTNNSTNNSTNNATNNPLPCGPDPNFFGPISTPTTTSYSFDANLSSVLANVPFGPDDSNTIENEGVYSPAVPIQVNQAIVTATGFQPTRSFWVQDRNVAIEVFLASDLLNAVVPGQIVSFTVSELTNYEGHPEITSIGSFVVHSSNNPVPYRQANNRDLTMNDYGYVVKLGGELLPNPILCGGNKTCYDLEHSGRISILRSASTFLAPGDCVTYVGPVRSFPGPRGTSGGQTPQLDTINFDWLHERF